MWKLLLTATLIILALPIACSDSSQETLAPRNIDATPLPPANTPEPEGTAPAQTPASTAAPTPTAASEATPNPSPTPEPTSTPPPIPEDETPAGVLSPLSVHGDEIVDSELSDAELECIKEIGPFMYQRWDFILPGPGYQEERAKIIGCLEDETVARIFVADTAEGVPTLSLESSACIRAAFKVIDPRLMMLAKVEGFPEDTLSSATILSLVTMACLNDAEWETAAELLREESELRELMRCMMEKLGGPGEMTAAMTAEDEEHQKALAESATVCTEETRPVPDGEPAVLAEKPEPASTPEPASIAPLDPDDSPDLLSRLSEEERDCITDVESLADFWSRHPFLGYVVDYEEVAQQFGCLGDETLLDLHLANLAWYFQDLGGELMVDTTSCIQDGLEGIGLGTLIHEAHTAEPRFVREMYTAFRDLTVFYCLSEEEAALAASDSGITDEEYDGMVCVVDAFGGLKGMNKAYRNTGAEELTEMLMTNLYSCPGA